MSQNVAELNWPGAHCLPNFQTVQHLDVYDIRGATYDTQLTISSLVGLVNRPQPRIYLISGDDEDFWLKEVLHEIPQTRASATGNAALQALLERYRSVVQGMFVYDPALLDSVNIATMLAAQRDGIVVSPTQVAQLKQTYNLEELDNLARHHWRTRLQAYDWAYKNLLSGATTHLVAGFSPNGGSGLRSFLVATKAFIYWLDSRRYLPDFSVGLLSERALMNKILQHFQPGTVHVGWFLDESSGVKLTSQAAISVLATDLFANAEVWSGIQSSPPPAPPAYLSERTNRQAENKVYVSFTMSDGDNLQYSQHRLLRLWRDPARGSVPIGWTFSPALLQAAPALALYYLSSATANDEMIAGPSGATYIFPSHWPREHLPAYLQTTGRLMQSMHMSTIAVLDTTFMESAGLPLLARLRHTGMSFTNPRRQESYAQELSAFGVRGIFSGAGLSRMSWKKVYDLHFYQNLGLAGNVKQTLSLIRNAAARNRQRPLFLNVYMLAWTITPTDLKNIADQLGSDYEVVLPGTLVALLEKASS